MARFVAELVVVGVGASCVGGGPCAVHSLGFQAKVPGTLADLSMAEITICDNADCKTLTVSSALAEGVMIGSWRVASACPCSNVDVTLYINTGLLVAGDTWRLMVVDRAGTTRFDEARTVHEVDDDGCGEQPEVDF